MALAPWACPSVGLRPANKVLTGKKNDTAIFNRHSFFIDKDIQTFEQM